MSVSRLFTLVWVGLCNFERNVVVGGRWFSNLTCGKLQENGTFQKSGSLEPGFPWAGFLIKETHAPFVALCKKSHCRESKLEQRGGVARTARPGYVLSRRQRRPGQVVKGPDWRHLENRCWSHTKRSKVIYYDIMGQIHWNQWIYVNLRQLRAWLHIKSDGWLT